MDRWIKIYDEIPDRNSYEFKMRRVLKHIVNIEKIDHIELRRLTVGGKPSGTIYTAGIAVPVGEKDMEKILMMLGVSE